MAQGLSNFRLRVMNDSDSRFVFRVQCNGVTVSDDRGRHPPAAYTRSRFNLSNYNHRETMVERIAARGLSGLRPLG